MANLDNISVTILVKNSRNYLPEVLAALQPFGEVVVYDNGSSDDTLEIARSFGNVAVYEGTFTGFGPTHNQASALAKNDWILSIDSDEVASVTLIEEIKSTPLEEGSVYSIPRENLFNGKVIRGCGWAPDRVWRLYNRKRTHFSDAQVHEQVIIDGMRQIELKGSLRHYSYRGIDDFLSKMQHYSELFVAQQQGKKRSSPIKALFHGWWSFFKTYLIKRGFRDGYEGLIISLYNGHTAYYKYLKLWQKQESGAKSEK